MNLRFFQAFKDSNIEKKKATYTRIFKRLSYSIVMSSLLGIATQSFASTCSEACWKHQESVTQMCDFLKGKVTPWVVPLAMPTEDGIIICDCPCGIIDNTPSGILPVEYLEVGDVLNTPLISRFRLPTSIVYR